MLLIVPGPVLALGTWVLTQAVLKETVKQSLYGGAWAWPSPRLPVLVPTRRALGCVPRGPRPRAGSLAGRAGGLHAGPRPPRLPAAAGLLSTPAYCLPGVGGSVIGAARSPDSEEVNAPCLNPPLTL